jgi:CubicO group peptidase (beta-lactamase class C family)
MSGTGLRAVSANAAERGRTRRRAGAPRGDGPADGAERDRQYAVASRAGLGLHAGCSQEPSSGRQLWWGGIYGTQFWIDPANRVVGLIMTQTAVIGSGAISNPIREAFYSAD